MLDKYIDKYTLLNIYNFLYVMQKSQQSEAMTQSPQNVTIKKILSTSMPNSENETSSIFEIPLEVS